MPCTKVSILVALAILVVAKKTKDPNVGKRKDQYPYWRQALDMTGISKIDVKKASTGVMGIGADKVDPKLGIIDPKTGLYKKLTTKAAAKDYSVYQALKQQHEEYNKMSVAEKAVNLLNKPAALPEKVDASVFVRDKTAELANNAMGRQSTIVSPQIKDTNKFLGMSSFGWYRGGIWVLGTMCLTGSIYAGYKFIRWCLGKDKKEKIDPETGRSETHNADVEKYEQQIAELQEQNGKVVEGVQKARGDFKLFYVAGTILHLLIIGAFVYAIWFNKSEDDDDDEDDISDGENMV